MTFKKLVNRNLLPLLVVLAMTTIAENAMSQVQLSNIPTLYINTQNGVPVDSKDTYVSATLRCISSDASENLVNEVIQIRGRGNSTWYMAKKPYRIKFSRKLNFLSLPAKQDNWVLLANYADKTLLRNAVAFELGKKAGFEFTPSVQFVDVVLNGEYIGNYMITDQVEVKSDRVNIQKLDVSMTSLPDISGGYLLEADGFASGNVKFTTQQGMNIVVKYPDEEDINNSQKQYIASYVQQFETALFSSSFKIESLGYRKYVDIPSLVNWYLCSEITGNPDSFWSTYFYKRRNDPHLYFGPLWDFDISFNNDNRLGDATQKLMSAAAHEPKTWIKRFLSDPWFHDQVSRRWSALKKEGIRERLLDYLETMKDELNTSQQLNFERWNILNSIVYRELDARGTYEAEVDFLHDYLVDRFAFLDTKFQSGEITAVENDDNEISFTVYPHPADEGSILSLTSFRPGALDISIYDGTGRIVYQQTKRVAVGTITMPLVKLPNGMYILRVGINDKKIQTRKMVVKN